MNVIRNYFLKFLLEKEYAYILEHYKDDKELKLDNIFVLNKFRLRKNEYKIYKALYYRTKIKPNNEIMERIRIYNREKWRREHPDSERKI